MDRAPEEPDDDLRDAAVSRIYQRAAARTAVPQGLDRRILESARKAHHGSQYLAPLAFAASVLLSVAVVLAIAFGPRAARHAEEPVRVLRAAARTGSPPTGAPRPALRADRVQAHVPGPDLAPSLLGKPRLYTSDPPASRPAPLAPAPSAPAAVAKGTARDAQRWLAAIAALRKAGRGPEAEDEYRRFRAAYPATATALEAASGR